jgi:hypothetical protein
MSRNAKKRLKAAQCKRAPEDQHSAPATHITASNAASRRFLGLGLQVLVFAIAFGVIFSRRPDAILNAQFYAEDGMNWYPDAYIFGLRSFLIPVAGYLHFLIRTVALFALLFPFSLAPLVMNACAVVVQILPINFFLSSRFSNIPFKVRLLGSALYLALPNSYEIDANITNVQWHLVLLACMVLLALPPKQRGWKYFDVIVLVVTSLSSPIAVVLLISAAVLWWLRRENRDRNACALLLPGSLIEVGVALVSHTRQSVPNGATIDRLVSILGRQVFLSCVLGMDTQMWLAASGLSIVEWVTALVGIAGIVYVFIKAPVELKVLIGFSFSVLALGLVRPLAGDPRRPQWEWLCVPGCGNRYYFLPMLSILASLLWLVSQKSAPVRLRYFAFGLLMLMPIGIYQDWSYPPYKNLGFSQYATQFEHAAPGTKVSIPINPGMLMHLTKR